MDSKGVFVTQKDAERFQDLSAQNLDLAVRLALQFGEQLKRWLSKQKKISLQKKNSSSTKDNSTSPIKSEATEELEPLETDGLSIFNNNQLVYKQDKNELTTVNKLTPELIGHLQVASFTPVGQMVRAGGQSLEVKLGSEVLLATDSSGAVVTNQYQLDKVHKQSSQQKGVEVAENSVAGLQVSPEIKQFLAGMLLEVKSINHKVEQQNTQINSLIKQRLQANRNPNWWSQSRQLGSSILSELSDFFTQSSQGVEAAQTVFDLFSRGTLRGEDTYYAEDYTITKVGNSYTLTSQANDMLLKFRQTSLGIKVIENNLPNSLRTDLKLLREQLDERAKSLGKFNRYGTEEVNHFAKISQITEAMTNYAASRQQKVEVVGKNYRWTATPNGHITIYSANNGQPLLLKTEATTVNRLSQRDLSFFERVLPQLRSSSITPQQPSQSGAKTAKANKVVLNKNKRPTQSQVVSTEWELE